MTQITQLQAILRSSAILIICFTNITYSNISQAHMNTLYIGQNFKVQTPTDVLQMTPIQMNVNKF